MGNKVCPEHVENALKLFGQAEFVLYLEFWTQHTVKQLFLESPI